MCVLSVKLPIRKNSGNLTYAPRTFDLHDLNIFDIGDQFAKISYSEKLLLAIRI